MPRCTLHTGERELVAGKRASRAGKAPLREANNPNRTSDAQRHAIVDTPNARKSGSRSMGRARWPHG
jgi:hypothetical protein